VFGKSFTSMYQGSMVGAGSHVFAVWGYCISWADPENHTVDLNPILLATVIGDSVERIMAAIAFLCNPDPKSHCTEHGGARLVHQYGHSYFLVTHEQYRDIKNSEDLRAYFREAQRLHRLSKTVKDGQRLSTFPASASASVSDSLSSGDCQGEDFLAFWKYYPKKKAKIDAFKAWKQTKDVRPADIATILAAVEAQKKSQDWQEEGGRYIPFPASWLRAGQWDDVVTEYKPDSGLVEIAPGVGE